MKSHGKQLLTSAVMILLVHVAPCVGATFFVAPNGSDANPGTLKQPFGTLGRARDEIRKRIAAGLDENVTVLIRGGEYRLDETVVFGLEGSGTNKHSIIYAAYPNEKPVFTSGMPIKGWQRLADAPDGLPASARGKVWVADLPKGLSKFLTLYDGTTRLPRARSKGYTPARRYPRTRQPGWRNTLEFRAGTLRDWPNLSDVEILIVPQYPWVSNLLPLASVDGGKGVAKTGVSATYPMGQVYFGRFPNGTLWAENVVEFLDEPGEWVVSLQERKLYLWPKDDRPSDAIVAPKLTEFIRVEGEIDYDGPVDKPVKNLTFRGLTFTHGDRWPWEVGKTGWGLQHDWEMFDRPTALVRFRGAEQCGVEDCHFVNSGGAGVRLDLHCQENRVIGNHIERIGGVGVLLAGYGPGTKDVNKGNSVINNRIHRVGELLWHSSGIFAWQSGENRIANNLIHDTPYTAIVVSGRIHWDRKGQGECSKTIRWPEIGEAAPTLSSGPGWRQRERFLHGRRNRVERNEIHHTMQVLGDGNCIYISGAGAGNIVRQNYLHDVDSANINANIRCDDDQHQTLIEENVIFRCCGEGFISKGNNTIVNNIVANLRPNTSAGVPCGHTRGYLVLPYGSVKGSVIQRNIFYAQEAGQTVLFEGSRHKVPTLLRDCKADYNLYFNAADPEWGSRFLKAQRLFGIEEHSVSADPLFVDIDNGDFQLQEGSPALKLGFRPIDLSEVGPKK